jgi:arginase
MSGKLIALDMVEINPILDERNKTGLLACELILSLLGKTVTDKPFCPLPMRF